MPSDAAEAALEVVVASQVPSRVDTGLHLPGAADNPLLLAVNQVNVFPVAVFPPLANSAIAGAATRAAAQPLVVSHRAAELNPLARPERKLPIAVHGKVEVQPQARAVSRIEVATGRTAPAHARVIDQIEVAIGRTTPAIGRVIGQIPGITARRIAVTIAAIVRKRSPNGVRTARKVVLIVPKRARMVCPTG